MSNVQENKAAIPPALADTLAMYNAKISETKNFLAHNPDPRLTSGARDLLAEYEAKRAKVLLDFEHPAPAPPPPPTPELVKRISDEVQAMLPQIVAEVVVRLQKRS
jgi:hypothetical protein